MDIETCEGVGGALYTAKIDTADWREIPSSAHGRRFFNDVTNWNFLFFLPLLPLLLA